MQQEYYHYYRSQSGLPYSSVQEDFQNMPRGGKRAGAGKPSTWVSKCKFADTKLIRIPKIHAAELLEIAHELDEQETENMTGTKPFFSGRIPQDLYDAVEKHRVESGEAKTEVRSCRQTNPKFPHTFSKMSMIALLSFSKNKVVQCPRQQN